MITHRGEIISYWHGSGTQEDPNRNKVVDLIQGYVQDITCTPSGQLYNPDPNACVCYVEATEAEFQTIDADPDHVVLWYEPIPELLI